MIFRLSWTRFSQGLPGLFRRKWRDCILIQTINGLVCPHILGLEVLCFRTWPAERIRELVSLYFLSVHRGKWWKPGYHITDEDPVTVYIPTTELQLHIIIYTYVPNLLHVSALFDHRQVVFQIRKNKIMANYISEDDGKRRKFVDFARVFI
jgi:hypothetical protein